MISRFLSLKLLLNILGSQNSENVLNSRPCSNILGKGDELFFHSQYECIFNLKIFVDRISCFPYYKLKLEKEILKIIVYH
jgi:hypothetical protein